MISWGEAHSWASVAGSPAKHLGFRVQGLRAAEKT